MSATTVDRCLRGAVQLTRCGAGTVDPMLWPALAGELRILARLLDAEARAIEAEESRSASGGQ